METNVVIFKSIPESNSSNQTMPYAIGKAWSLCQNWDQKVVNNPPFQPRDQGELLMAGACLIRECVFFENGLRASKYEKEYDQPDSF
jgi:hypothetical protein